MSEIIKPKLVVVESPFKGKNWSETRRNVLYAKLLVKEVLKEGNFPYASHLFFTQTGILDDTILEERLKGAYAGLAITKNFDKSLFGIDFGMSSGMSNYGLKEAEKRGREVEYRKLRDSMDLEYELNKIGEAKPFIDLHGLLF